MEKIVFVVLHYESIDDTKECLDSLLKYINNEVEIVVVDNGSIHGKVESIEKEYNNQFIHFLHSKENLGFAKGNNLGYKYAKEKIGAKIIILCNNDLLFKQMDFVERLLIFKRKTEFDVAGPRIMSLIDGKNQNPVPVQYKTISQLNKRIIKYYALLFLSFFNLDAFVQSKVAKEIIEYHPKDGEDYQLFGACLIFSNRFISLFDGLYDKTFMYNEESILKERVIRYSLKMQYCDDLIVEHKEGASTKSTYGKGKKKRQFYYRWNINSCWLLRSIKKGAEV